MQPLELTALQWEPLLLLHLQRADTVAALARESQVNCSAMTRMLDRLEEKQLLERRRSVTDRRVVHLALTEKGQQVCEAIEPLVNAELNGSSSWVQRQGSRHVAGPAGPDAKEWST